MTRAHRVGDLPGAVGSGLDPRASGPARGDARLDQRHRDGHRPAGAHPLLQPRRRRITGLSAPRRTATNLRPLHPEDVDVVEVLRPGCDRRHADRAARDPYADGGRTLAPHRGPPVGGPVEIDGTECPVVTLSDITDRVRREEESEALRRRLEVDRREHRRRDRDPRRRPLRPVGQPGHRAVRRRARLHPRRRGRLRRHASRRHGRRRRPATRP